jgi:hypothetical protein
VQGAFAVPFADAELVAVQGDDAPDPVRLGGQAGGGLLVLGWLLRDAFEGQQLPRQHLVDGGQVAAAQQVPAGSDAGRAAGQEEVTRRAPAAVGGEAGCGGGQGQGGQADEGLAAGEGMGRVIRA